MQQPIRDCPFCLENMLLKGEILSETETAFLISALQAGNYLIIPKAHAETPFELADTWWRDVKKLLGHVPVDLEQCNLSFNLGEHAGQSVQHLHLWVVPRRADEPASGKGLATLIKEQNGVG